MNRIYEEVTKHPELRRGRGTEDAFGPLSAERVVQANADYDYTNQTLVVAPSVSW